MNKLEDVTDVKQLQDMIMSLWALLDDIDTLDDICREADDFYRNKTREYHKKRHDILTSDGYNLFLPSEAQE